MHGGSFSPRGGAVADLSPGISSSRGPLTALQDMELPLQDTELPVQDMELPVQDMELPVQDMELPVQDIWKA